MSAVGQHARVSRGPASRGSIWAIVLAAMAALGPVIMIALFIVLTAVPPRSGAIGGAVLVTMLAFGYEVAVGPIAAVISIVLAIAVRRRGGSSRRNSTIAFTILGISVSLVVLQVLLYLPR